MYKIENNILIRYNVEKFILLTTTKNFFQQNTSYKQKLQNYSSFINFVGKFLTQEKCFYLLEFLSKLGSLVADKTLLFCEQVHGNNIVAVNNIDLHSVETFILNNIIVKYLFFQKTDGIISLLPNTAVIIFTADCVPLFVYDTFGEVFGLVHVGRKGIENGIIESLVVKLEEISKKDKLRFKFIIGPHICHNCYFVDGKPYSLVDKIITTIKRHSFAVENITILPLCTYHMDNLFVSYRKNKTSCRLISFITPVCYTSK